MIMKEVTRMVLQTTDRERVKEVRYNAGGLEVDGIHDPAVGRRSRYRDVAFVSTGKKDSVWAAAERAVSMTEKEGVNLTPLDQPTQNVWRGRYDLVIAGSEEPWGLKDRVLGNTERQLVRHSPGDVLIVRHRPFAASRRIVVAIAPDPLDDRQTRLASETIRAAAEFADWDDSELHVVNVVPSFAYYMMAVNAGLPMDEAAGIEAEARRNQEALISEFLAGLNVERSRMRVHLLQGNPVQKIVNLVSRLDADMVVIGSIGRKGLGRLIIGNTAEKVARQVDCSYLVTKLSTAA
jgi:universal stress protein E